MYYHSDRTVPGGVAGMVARPCMFRSGMGLETSVILASMPLAVKTRVSRARLSKGGCGRDRFFEKKVMLVPSHFAYHFSGQPKGCAWGNMRRSNGAHCDMLETAQAFN